ncbi:MAG: DoxX family protein [Pseudomonadota bacterium]
MAIVTLLRNVLKPSIGWLALATPLIDLVLRLYVANIFWKSGQTKIANMDQTVQLFEYVYQVPVLPPAFAAYLATYAELIFPILLVLGLATRFAALSLTILNIVAVISFPDLNDAGLQQHIVWGIMLLVTLLHGPGKLAVDHWIHKKYWDE